MLINDCGAPLGLSCLRSGGAIYERALAGFTMINRSRPPRDRGRPQAEAGAGAGGRGAGGRGRQPALRCLDKQDNIKATLLLVLRKYCILGQRK